MHTTADSEALNLCSIIKVSCAKVMTTKAYGTYRSIMCTIPTAIVYTLESALSWLETFLDRLRNRYIRAGVAEWLSRWPSSQ
jgi:IS1 family transposase